MLKPRKNRLCCIHSGLWSTGEPTWCGLHAQTASIALQHLPVAQLFNLAVNNALQVRPLKRKAE